MSTIETTTKGFLSPVERFSEILFGLIMTLSITGTMSIVSEGQQEVGTTLLSVLGCNLAWGIIDAILYLLAAASDRGRGYALYDFIRKTDAKEEARAAIAGALPAVIADLVQPDELETVRQRLVKLPDQPRPRMITKEELGGAAGVCLLVVLSCIPIIVPFLLIQHPRTALRVSNAVAIVMLFVGGYFLAKYAGNPKIRTGLLMVALGIVMVGITIALGG